MPWSKVKDIALSALVAASTAEYLSAFEPGNKNKLIWGRNLKTLAVHFFLRNFNVLPKTFSNRMSRLNHPDSLLLAIITPFQSAGIGTH
ncbi:hypothetical protein D3C80_1949020 [compost metagenome]